MTFMPPESDTLSLRSCEVCNCWKDMSELEEVYIRHMAARLSLIALDADPDTIHYHPDHRHNLIQEKARLREVIADTAAELESLTANP